MKRNLLLKTMLLLCAIVFGTSSSWATSYVPVTSVEQLVAGNNYLIVGRYKTNKMDSPTWASMGSWGSNIYSSTSITVSGDINSSGSVEDVEITDGLSAHVLTLGGATGAWTFYDTTEEKYLSYSGSSNQIHQSTTAATNNQKWTITFNDKGIATISNKAVTGRQISANLNSTRFACYTSAQQSNSTYLFVEVNTSKHTLSSAVLPVGAGTVTLDATSLAEGKTTTVTAAPNDGYLFVNWTVTGAGSSVSSATANPTSFTMGTEDATITANFEAIPTHTVTWSVNGAETSEDVAEGVTITFPAKPTDVGGKTFVGWTETAIDGITDVAPQFVTSATMGTSDLKYYAVYANVNGTPSSLTKMSSDETFTNGDKIVIVAYDTDAEKYYAPYQETQNTSWIGKYEFDGDVETVAADDKNWLTVTASESNWILGDDTNGYLYSNESNNLVVSTDNSTAFALAYSEGNGFTFKSTGNRWLSLRTDADKNKFRLGGNGASPLGVGYFDIYKYVAGNASYSGYCTSVTVTLTPAKTYTTLTSAYALNFTDVSGLEAYIAKDGVSEGSVKMTQVNKVPANTGLVLKATTPNSAVNIPVFDGTGADDVSGNLMVGSATETTAIEKDGGYILSNGVFQPASAGTLAAGKAYLQIAVTSARSLEMSFDDATTAINGIEEVAPVNVKTRKVVKNGRLVIETANGEFTIDGARMK